MSAQSNILLSTKRSVAGSHFFYNSSTNTQSITSSPVLSLVTSNIGIGTTNPLQALHVVGGVNVQTPTLSSAGTAWAYLPFDNSLVDTVGNLTINTSVGIKYSTQVSKVGTACLDLTGNVPFSVYNTYAIYTGSLSTTSGITIACWVNIGTETLSGSQQWIIHAGNGLTATTYGLQMFVNMVTPTTFTLTAQCYVQPTNTWPSTATTAGYLTANTWYHIAATTIYTGGAQVITLYVNGVQVNTTSLTSANSIYSTLNYLVIGYDRNVGPQSAFYGYIDDVRIYNSVLNITAISALYTSTTSNTYLANTNNFGNAVGIGTTNPQKQLHVYGSGMTVTNSSTSYANAGGLTPWAYLPFDGSLTETIGNLTSPVGTGIVYTSVGNMVGQSCLDLRNNPNTNSSTATSYVIYTGSLAANPGFTVALWFNFMPTTSGNQNIFATGTASLRGLELQLIYTNSTTATIYAQLFYNNATQVLTTFSNASIVTANTWYHLIVSLSYNGTTAVLVMYINGVQVSTNSLTTSLVSATYTSFVVGAISQSYVYGFPGYVDDVRIYNSVLSAGNVSGIYNAVIPAYTTQTVSQFNGLVGIGVQTPQAPLHVLGNLVVTGGNVGIGTTNPQQTLHVSNGDSSLAIFGPGSTYTGSLIIGASTGAKNLSSRGSLTVDNGSTHLNCGSTGVGLYLNDYAQSTYIQSFSPWTHNSSLYTTGSVGIGTTNPTSSLHIANTGTLCMPYGTSLPTTCIPGQIFMLISNNVNTMAKMFYCCTANVWAMTYYNSKYTTTTYSGTTYFSMATLATTSLWISYYYSSGVCLIMNNGGSLGTCSFIWSYSYPTGFTAVSNLSSGMSEITVSVGTGGNAGLLGINNSGAANNYTVYMS